MVARTRPARKIGQVNAGPTDQKRLPQAKKSPPLSLASPAPPSSEKRGYRSAVATPRRAVAAASSRSRRRCRSRPRDCRPGCHRTCCAGGRICAAPSASSPPPGAQGDIGARQLGEQAQHGAVALLGRGVEVGGRCRHRPPGTAEQVEFPTGIEAGLKQVVGSARGIQRRGVGALALAPGRAARIHRRPACPRRDPQAGARRPQPRLCALQVEVGAHRPRDQAIEHGIVERLPPGQRRGRHRRPVVRCRTPSGRHVHCGGMIVGADRAARRGRGKRDQGEAAAGAGTHGAAPAAAFPATSGAGAGAASTGDTAMNTSTCCPT